jgi:hypothetical protein
LASLLKEFEDAPHRPRLQVSISCAEFDFEINVIPHEKIPSKVVYKMSPIEQEELRRQLDELIAWIHKAEPVSHGSPVFFVKKKDGKLRMCVDYRPLTH